MKFRRLATFATTFVTAAFLAWGSAQDAAQTQSPDAEALIAELQSAAEALEDATFTAEGSYLDEDGGTQAFSAEIAVIFGADVARITFTEPAELAGNIVVLENNTLRNYVAEDGTVLEFSMNAQDMATENDADTETDTSTDPDADDSEADADAAEMSTMTPNAMPDVTLFGLRLDALEPLSLELSNLFEDWTGTVQDSAEGSYELRFEGDLSDLDYIDVRLLEQGGQWLPETMTFVRDGETVLEVTLSDIETNTGLAATGLTTLQQD